jgi:cytochrome c biogenesis protein CcmG/thiol:disulfide interchange protein DsbE
MKQRLLLLAPLIMAVVLFFFFHQGLKQDPKLLPSALINHPAPAFSLETLNHHTVNEKIFLHHETLLNVWASWCETCQQEQAYLLLLKNQYPRLQIIGMNYKDDPKAATHWLQQYGNPYQLVIADRIGTVAIDYGIYGTPESFLINADGRILAKHTGVLDQTAFTQKFLPLILQ